MCGESNDFLLLNLKSMSTLPSVGPTSFADITSGALTTLAAQGSFNQHVTCDPQQTHFPGQAFQRHVHFALAHIPVCVDQKPSPAYSWPDNYKVSATLSQKRAGDLLGSVMLYSRYSAMLWNGARVDNTAQQVGTVDNFAIAQVQKARLMIGDQVLEEHTGDALFIMNEMGWQGPGLDTSYMHSSHPGVYGSVTDYAGGPWNANNIQDPVQVRVAEASEYATDLHFHMGNGHDQDDAVCGYLNLANIQYQKVKVEVELRKKVGLIRGKDVAGGGAISETDLSTNILNQSTGNFGLLDMHFWMQVVFLSPEERVKRAKLPETKIVKYIDEIASQRISAGTSEIEFKLDTENNTSSLIAYYARDNRLDDSAKDYFDFSVPVNDGLVPSGGGLVNAAPTFIYHPRSPVDRIILKNNNNTIIDAPSLFWHHASPYLVRHHKLPSQFIFSHSFGTHPTVYNRHTGSQADSRIDSVLMRVLLAKNNDAGTGIAHAGTLKVIAIKYTALTINKGQVGILYPSH